MIKNTAGQTVGAQMTTAADGSAFTGSVTVSVTGDAGAQATGSVGSGACTHEGKGYHTYAPAQAETNYDLAAFTFEGTGAITTTVQIFTNAGDAFTRLGAPAGASVSADIAAVKVDTAAILVDTGTTLDGRIPAALVSGRMDASVGAMAANVLTTAAINDGAITAPKFSSSAIDSNALADNAITQNKIAALAISSSKFATGAITAATFAANAITAAKLDPDVTTELQAGLATAAALDAIDDFLDTEMAAVLVDTSTTLDDMVDDLETRLTQALADKLAAHALSILTLVVDAGSSTTAVVFKTVNGAAASAVDDFYNGAVIVFTSGALLGQRTSITDYVGATKTATVVALTGAPAENVTGVIV